MRTRHITIARRLAIFFVEADGFASVRARRGFATGLLRRARGQVLVSAPVSLSRARRRRAAAGNLLAAELRGWGLFVSWSRTNLSPDLVAVAATRKRAPVGPPYHYHFRYLLVLGARSGHRRYACRRVRIRSRRLEAEVLREAYPAARRPMRSPRPMAPRARRLEFPPLRPLPTRRGRPAGFLKFHRAKLASTLAGLQQEAEMQ